ncbi:hypothetical protein AHiyo8_50310 [Arthrobacter sp. Hiyo8]|nr:hypothetical protein AHiyo8_50310 [Arthrobacter sp. Hiyo8]
MDHHFTVMDGNEPDRKPVACGAYAEWQGILADMGVLVPPDLRRQGLGTLAASIAAHEALASGLTLQWRTALDNRAPWPWPESWDSSTGASRPPSCSANRELADDAPF